MTKMYDIANSQALNVGNAYTYTVLAADKAKYSGFMLTTGSTVTISDGTNSVALTIAANEEIPLNDTTTSIVDTVTNTIVWLF